MFLQATLGNESNLMRVLQGPLTYGPVRSTGDNLGVESAFAMGAVSSDGAPALWGPMLSGQMALASNDVGRKPSQCPSPGGLLWKVGKTHPGSAHPDASRAHGSLARDHSHSPLRLDLVTVRK